VDDGWTGFIILRLGDPHLLEGTERGQNGATNPDTVLPLWWRNHLHLHAAGGKRSDLLAHTVTDTREHCGATTEDDIAVQIFPDIDIALHDGVVRGFMDTRGFHANERWLEQHLGALNLSAPIVMTWPSGSS